MGSPVDVNFYSNLLGQAQQNLDRGVAIKAAAIEKLYDIPFLTKEDSDAVVGKAQDILKNATEGNLVSPSRVANAVMSANAEVMPGVQAAKAKAKAADMYERMRLQYGPNAWMADDPATISIIDKNTGKYVDPNTFKAKGIDASEVDKTFLGSQLSVLTRQSEPTYSKGKLPGYYLERQTTGLSEDEKRDAYYPGTSNAIKIAEDILKTHPQVLDAFNGDREKALQQVQLRNWQTTGNYKYSVDTKPIEDKAWLNALESEQLKKLKTPTVTPGGELLFTPTENPITPSEGSPIINDFRKTRDLYRFASKNKGKLEMFVDNKDEAGRSQGSQLTNVVTGLGYRPDIQGVSNALGDYKFRKNSPELYNSYIETAILLNPSLEKQVYKNKEGIYEMKNPAIRTLFAKTLNDAQNSENTQIDKITSKYAKAYNSFKSEYSDMFNVLTKDMGMSSDDAMDRIVEWEAKVPVTNSYDLNNPDVAQRLHTNLVSSTGMKRNVYEVDPETQEYSTKAENARDVLTKENAGDIINAKANPSKGSVELTYQTKDGYKTYAILADKGGMDNVSKEAMKTLQEFNEALFTAKSPETVVYNPYEIDRQTGGYIGYRVIRDLKTGVPEIYEVRIKEGKPFMQSQNPVSQGDVLNRYLTQVFTSTTTENKILKPEL